MQPHHIRKIVPTRPAQTHKPAPAQFTGNGQQLLKALNLDALRKRAAEPAQSASGAPKGKR